jgi:hypothetical protein
MAAGTQRGKAENTPLYRTLGNTTKRMPAARRDSGLNISVPPVCLFLYQVIRQAGLCDVGYAGVK